MGKRRKSRILALQLIYQYDRGPEPLEEILDSFWESQGYPEPDVRRFAEDLAGGAIEKLDEIESVIATSSENWDPGRMAVIDRSILRLALYELLFRADIPPKVTMNEYVDIAKKYSTEESGPFVNGILDRVYQESLQSEPSEPLTKGS